MRPADTWRSHPGGSAHVEKVHPALFLHTDSGQYSLVPSDSVDTMSSKSEAIPPVQRQLIVFDFDWYASDRSSPLHPRLTPIQVSGRSRLRPMGP